MVRVLHPRGGPVLRWLALCCGLQCLVACAWLSPRPTPPVPEEVEIGLLVVEQALAATRTWPALRTRALPAGAKEIRFWRITNGGVAGLAVRRQRGRVELRQIDFERCFELDRRRDAARHPGCRFAPVIRGFPLDQQSELEAFRIRRVHDPQRGTDASPLGALWRALSAELGPELTSASAACAVPEVDGLSAMVISEVLELVEWSEVDTFHAVSPPQDVRSPCAARFYRVYAALEAFLGPDSRFAPLLPVPPP